jgi:hypothetical protein
MTTIEYCKNKELKRGTQPLGHMNMDGSAIQALLNSRQHAELRARVQAAKSSDFVVYVATELGEKDALLRRCVGAELRARLMRVVLPLASERLAELQPQMMIDSSNPAAITYAPTLDSDHDPQVVPYLVTFFASPIAADAFPPTLVNSTARELLAANSGDQQQLVCVLQLTCFERNEMMYATDTIMGALSQCFVVRHVCGGCGIVVDGRLKCGLCKHAYYCGKACQGKHWQAGGHKLACARTHAPRCAD